MLVTESFLHNNEDASININFAVSNNMMILNPRSRDN